MKSTPIHSRLAAALAFAAAGCTPTWAEAPRVPNPVLLGPVDRIGGHRAAAAPEVGRVDDEVGAFQAVSTTETRQGNVILRQTQTVVMRDGSAKWSVALLRATQGKHDVDVRVEGVEAKSRTLLLFGYVSLLKRLTLHGAAVRSGVSP